PIRRFLPEASQNDFGSRAARVHGDEAIVWTFRAPTQQHQNEREHRHKLHFPASFCFSIGFTTPGSTFVPCCFMNIPMACPSCFSVKLFLARNSSTSFAVSSGEAFLGR